MYVAYAVYLLIMVTFPVECGLEGSDKGLPVSPSLSEDSPDSSSVNESEAVPSPSGNDEDVIDSLVPEVNENKFNPDTVNNNENAGVLNDFIQQYASRLMGDLKKAPPSDLSAALARAVPKLQQEMEDYSQNLDASSRKQANPNPLLIGFSYGLKVWAEHMSRYIPILKRMSQKSFVHKDFDAMYEFEVKSMVCDGAESDSESVCYEETAEKTIAFHGHPCCQLSDVCCVPILI